jgi:hypothetical protein
MPCQSVEHTALAYRNNLLIEAFSLSFFIPDQVLTLVALLVRQSERGVKWTAYIYLRGEDFSSSIFSHHSIISEITHRFYKKSHGY